MTGTKISDMEADSTFPADAYIPMISDSLNPNGNYKQLLTSRINGMIGATLADGDLGAFSGSIIADDSNVKAALQALETATELRPTSATLAASGGSALIGFLQSGTGAEARTQQSRGRDVVSVLDFIPPAEEAAIRAGTSTYDCTADIQAAIDSMSENLGESGGILYFPIGLYNISEPIVQGNWVSLRGAGKGSQIWAMSGFTGTEMVTVDNGVTSMFHVSIEDLFFDGKSRVDNIIHAYAWQENGGMSKCVLQGFNVNGILIEDGNGGASLSPLTDLEIFGTSLSAQYGIRVNQISLVGAFMLDLKNITITGESGNTLAGGVYCRNDSINAQTVHFEHADFGFLIEGVGNHVIDGVTGGPGVGTIIALDAAFTGTLAGRGLNPNTATSFVVRNFVTSENIASSEGAIVDYTYPNYNFEASLTSQITNVTGNGTSYTVLFPQTRDIGGWYNPATGIATAPKSGKYQFSTFLGLSVDTGVTALNIALVTTGKTFILFRGGTDSIRTAGNLVTLGGSVTADLNAGDTARVVITATGLGADTIDIEAGESVFTGAYLYR